MSAVVLPARKAVKFAALGVDPTAGSGVFLPYAVGVPYPAESTAVCARGATHAVPDPGCTCGFYAARSFGDLLDLLHPTLAQLAGSALLDVELGGIELAGPYGMRAGEQRVLGAGLIRLCAQCMQAPRSGPAPAAHLYLLPYAGRDIPYLVRPLCDDHAAEAHTAEEIGLGDLSGLMRTEVSWAPRELLAQIAERHQIRLAAGQPHGPLLAHRRVCDLRMGQVGFTPVASVRLDSGGRLWVSANATAAQRPRRTGDVAVLRAVGLWLELVITTDTAGAVDAAVATPRPAQLRCTEMPVDVVHGTRRAPRLAAALGY
ncbi:MAG TPA: hypothetical protein VM307_02115 [Egibacteraceae bacterium]|nr:hypothetical protein [Egibacteraceae bacterium]